jgi:uncharacterized membrane protein
MAKALPRWQRPVAIAAALFGGLTILSGGLALFGPKAAQDAVGDAVSFVLIFNFTAGFVYVAGALALWLNHPSARAIAWGLALATLAVFAAFLWAALTGVPYEMRTLGAMTLRAGFWLVIALLLARSR